MGLLNSTKLPQDSVSGYETNPGQQRSVPDVSRILCSPETCPGTLVN